MTVITSPAALAAARRERRTLTLWRMLAVGAFVLACLAVAWGAGAFTNLATTPAPHIARVAIQGPIFEDRKFLELLERIGEDESVQGVIVEMNSPGGTTVGGEAIYEAVKALGEKKPVVTQVGTLAASAGYMIAAGTDHIVVRRSSIIGSIGVIFTYADATALLGKIGVEVKDIKTGLLKAEPAPYSTPPPEIEPAIRELLDDTYQWFVDLVAEERDLPRATVLALADGRIVSGSAGVELKLADAIGGEAEAVAWLETERDVEADLDIRTWSVPEERDYGLLGLRTGASRLLLALGVDPSGSVASATMSAIEALAPLDSGASGGLYTVTNSGLQSQFRIGQTPAAR